MQAKLPDINASLVKHRDKMSHHIEHRNWRLVVMHFNAANALFPEEYKINVNTSLYMQKIQSKHLILCDFCDTWCDYTKVKPYNLRLNSQDRLILQQVTSVVWDCPNCKKTLLLDGSQKKNQVPMQPFYTQAVPNEPIRHGISDRVGHHAKMYNWADTAYRELEHQVGKYRMEYEAQHESDNVTITDEDNE